MTCWTGYKERQKVNWLHLSIALIFVLVACQPTVKVEAPPEPITINLNVKIEHEVRVKLEKDIDELLSEDDELF